MQSGKGSKSHTEWQEKKLFLSVRMMRRWGRRRRGKVFATFETLEDRTSEEEKISLFVTQIKNM